MVGGCGKTSTPAPITIADFELLDQKRMDPPLKHISRLQEILIIL